MTDVIDLQPYKFELDGQQHTVALNHWSDVQAADCQEENIMSSIMLSLSPINSYLFEEGGKLLHANNPAAHMIQNSGAHTTLMHRDRAQQVICCP